jgi:EmrB/QacA subfamily drug resistance transporter
MSFTAPREERAGRRTTVLAVAGLMLALFLVALDQTVVGTALPQIIADLQGFEQYAWVTTSYLLASTAMIPVVGKLGDVYGRKWFIVGGVLVFLVGSALCGAAWGMTELIIFRGIQGLGAGFIFANIFTSVADIFPDPARRAKYQGLFFGVFALSSVIGPTLGGWITDSFDWRWVFYINLPLGIFSLFALPAVLRQSAVRRDRVKIDYPGAITITASVVALLLALSWVGQGFDWSAPRVVWGFVISGVLLAAFVPLELRASEPVIPLSLFKSRTFTSATLLMFFVGFGMFGVILYTPLFVQGVLGESATSSGTVLTPLVLAMTLVGVLGGQVVARVKRVKPFPIIGAAVMAFGIYLLTTLGVDSSQTTVALYLLVTGLGLGLIMPNATLAVQTTVDRELLGVATSATQFVRSVGSTVGTAVVGSLVTSGYAKSLAANAPEQAPDRLVSSLENPQALVSDEARAALSEAGSALPGGEGVVDGLVEAARAALAGSIQDGFVVMVFTTGAAILAGFLMKNVRLDKAQEATVEPPEDGSPADGAALPAAVAAGTDGDATGDEDRDLARFLRSRELSPSASLKPGEADALLGIADRIEFGNGDYPALMRAAADLANGKSGNEHERAVHVSKTVIRPLAAREANGHSR